MPRRVGLDYPESCDDAVGRTLEGVGELGQERWFPVCSHASESGYAGQLPRDAGDPAPERLERYRALAQKSEALLPLGLRLEKGDAL